MFTLFKYLKEKLEFACLHNKKFFDCYLRKLFNRNFTQANLTLNKSDEHISCEYNVVVCRHPNFKFYFQHRTRQAHDDNDHLLNYYALFMLYSKNVRTEIIILPLMTFFTKFSRFIYS